jgi:SnoaL-like polyketide cyclase
MPLTIESMSIQEKNKELMITLDNAWNSQDRDIFDERHADDVAVFWPGQPDPRRGVHNHRQESIEFFKMFQIIILSTIPTKYSSQK